MNLIQDLLNCFFASELIKPVTSTPQQQPKPVVEVRQEKVPYQEELDKLCEVYGGDFTELTITLRDMLAVIPRHRQRIEAYRGLLSYAATKGKNITITSRKSKNA